MKKYYIVLSGAKKNAGDFLITESCKKLISRYRPDYELIQIRRDAPLDDKIELINSSSAIILLGGPGFTPSMYPKIYPLTKNLNDIKVPIVPMAVGWNTSSGTFKGMIDFQFDDNSLELLNTISSRSPFISVRDFYTYSILKRNGIKNVLMTGCSSWYYFLDSRFMEKKCKHVVDSIAFTPAQNPKFNRMVKEVMQEIRGIFPDKKIICSFHRGVGKVDEYTSVTDAENTKDILQYAEHLDMLPIDLSSDFKKYKEYDDVDFHIGFRVHAHLYFLASQKPSLLIHEDGRGKSMSETLGLYGIDSFKGKSFFSRFEKINSIFSRLSLPYRFFTDIDREVPERVNHLIVNHLDNNFSCFSGVFETIRQNYAVMEKFLENLPE